MCVKCGRRRIRPITSRVSWKSPPICQNVFSDLFPKCMRVVPADCAPVCPPAGNHWPDRRNHLFTLEATGYALLALVRLNRIKEAEALFKWLNSQRRRGGAFGSTQVLRSATYKDDESKARASVSFLPSSPSPPWWFSTHCQST